MENIEVLNRKLLSPSWKFWINKMQIIEVLKNKGDLSYPAIKSILKFCSETNNNGNKFIAFNAVGTIMSPFFQIMSQESEITFQNVNKLLNIARTKVIEANQAKMPPPELLDEFSILKGFLNNSDKNIVENTLFCLGMIGPYCYQYLNEIEEFTIHEDEFIRINAFYAIANISGSDTRFIYKVLDIIRDSKSIDNLKVTAMTRVQFAYNFNFRPYLDQLLNIPYIKHEFSLQVLMTLELLMHNEHENSRDLGKVMSFITHCLNDDYLNSYARGAMIYIGPAAIPYIIKYILNSPRSNSQTTILSSILVLPKIDMNVARGILQEYKGKINDEADLYIDEVLMK